MTSQHRYTARAYRPDPVNEYQPVCDALGEMGYCMNALIRAFLRWIVEDPTRLQQFVTLMRQVRADTPRGRPRQQP